MKHKHLPSRTLPLRRDVGTCSTEEDFKLTLIATVVAWLRFVWGMRGGRQFVFFVEEKTCV